MGGAYDSILSGQIWQNGIIGAPHLILKIFNVSWDENAEHLGVWPLICNGILSEQSIEISLIIQMLMYISIIGMWVVLYMYIN